MLKKSSLQITLGSLRLKVNFITRQSITIFLFLIQSNIKNKVAIEKLKFYLLESVLIVILKPYLLEYLLIQLQIEGELV